MSKTAPKLTAVPSMPPASNSKSSTGSTSITILTTSSPMVVKAPTVTLWRTQKEREAEHITIDKLPQPTEFRSWKISFKSEVLHFFAISQSRCAMDWES